MRSDINNFRDAPDLLLLSLPSALRQITTIQMTILFSWWCRWHQVGFNIISFLSARRKEPARAQAVPFIEESQLITTAPEQYPVREIRFDGQTNSMKKYRNRLSVTASMAQSVIDRQTNSVLP